MQITSMGTRQCLPMKLLLKVCLQGRAEKLAKPTGSAFDICALFLFFNKFIFLSLFFAMSHNPLSRTVKNNLLLCYLNTLILTMDRMRFQLHNNDFFSEADVSYEKEKIHFA